MYYMSQSDSIFLLDGVDMRRYRMLLEPLGAYLDDPETCNVVANSNGNVGVERFGRPYEKASEVMPRGRRMSLIKMIASMTGKTIDELHSRLECDLPHYDVRVQAFCPPAGDWSIMFRRHAARVYTFDEYVQSGAMLNFHRHFLAGAIRDGSTILISGQMSSGKTTFLDALMGESAQYRPAARALVVQDSHELKADAWWNAEYLYAGFDQAHHESGGMMTRYTYELPDVLKDLLRTGAEVIVWGEIRDGGSATGLVMALSVGSASLYATIHAKCGEEALSSLENRLRYAKTEVVREDIARSVNVIVHMEKVDNRPRVASIHRVLGAAGGQYQLETIS